MKGSLANLKVVSDYETFNIEQPLKTNLYKIKKWVEKKEDYMKYFSNYDLYKEELKKILLKSEEIIGIINKEPKV